MKKLTLLVALFIIIRISVLSQTCLSDGIIFNSQSKVDSFQINYPNCTEIEGNVIIDGKDITNLNGLSVLTSVSGTLIIAWSPITDLTGLDNMTSVGGQLGIQYLSNITNLTGVESLTSVGDGISINKCTAVTNLNGLENLTTVTGGGIVITGCNALTSISGIENINTNSISWLTITDNDSLSECEVQSVCNALGNPNIEIKINNNAPGCDSITQVVEACIEDTITHTTTTERVLNSRLSIYPNPANDMLTIEIGENAFVSFIDLSGKILFTTEIIAGNTKIPLAHLTPGGLIIIKIATKNDVFFKKVLVR